MIRFILLMLILSTIVVSPFMIQLYYVYTLEEEKCKCSTDWKRDYIKIFSFIAIMYLFMIVMSLFLGIEFYKNKVVKMLMGLASLINMIVLYVYIRKLKEIECGCALEYDNIYTFLKYYSLIGIVFMAASILMFVYTLSNKLMGKK